ncbi:unnamed protein product [Acanthoscelides obtectus]|uniref:POPDC1-3 domain-containing protein n=1 Tax=Acanthoscelides obtectus TaxID=200917 RepID=A0A9P0JW88_ACAOB|nr:unnamed protein product [Acanthoscelides obtectus]CAK1653034.1 Blood vessel epicardial substance [Acanthoscelides obtectus]
METSVILAKSFSSSNSFPAKNNSNNFKIKVRPTQANAMLDLNRTISVTSKPDSILGSSNHSYWNSSDYFYTTTNTAELEYDYQIINETSGEGSWTGSCKEWTPAQHNLFQTANFFFAAAFLVPGSFKQSILIVRALLSIGYFFTTIWGGLEVCAPDILLWNFIIVLLNATHTALLTWKFLPPTLTLELTELYLKVFKPLRVSKKHFKELVKEAKVMNLEEGDIYAVEDVSPADEKLSILLRGRYYTNLDYFTFHDY